MINIQETIIFLWFVPVLGYIVLPVFWMLCGWIYRAVERSRLADIQGFVALNNRDVSGDAESEKRNRLRIHLVDGSACIAEECDCCKALVSNISKHGICLRNVPGNMYLESNPFKVIFKTRQKDYTLTARPIWKRVIGQRFEVGAEIQKVSGGWNDMVKGLSQSFTVEPA